MAIFSFIARLDNMLGRNLPSSSSVDILTDQSIYGIKKFKNGIVVPNNTLVCAQLSDLDTYLANKYYLTRYHPTISQPPLQFQLVSSLVYP